MGTIFLKYHIIVSMRLSLHTQCGNGYFSMSYPQWTDNPLESVFLYDSLSSINSLIDNPLEMTLPLCSKFLKGV